ncbi:hypothetical protein K2173_002671 [Erythroxylum novogranatense]|uniref:Coilin n=1 Tax=Erythroxylum novogranatense TaxID=1862640 RepID=A0AAV8SWQ4_9ROSI|nr:hypothetical protein K2173_002671 [Erythroxylum novogranatense]
METVRLRLVFDHILRRTLKTEGLKRCWLLLKPQLKTISDLSSYLVQIFDLEHACSSCLVLSMEGFVLPPFESTSILKDKDIIRVRKKSGTCSELVEIDGVNSLGAVEIVDKQPVPTGMKLLANAEFEKEGGGYESESEEDVPDQEEGPFPEKKYGEQGIVSKKRKRKALKELQSSKRKRNRSASADKGAFALRNGEKDDSLELTETLNDAKADQTRDTDGKSLMKTNRSCQLKKMGNGSVDASSSPSEAKKVPSRSARRKKAKRQWLRAQAKAEKEKKQLLEKISQESPEKNNYTVAEKAIEFGDQEHSKEEPVKDINDLKEVEEQREQESDQDEDVVPVVIRPGHIRYKPRSKVGTGEVVQQNHISVENFQWNGITSKKKGQKWGKEKLSYAKGKNFKIVNQEPDIVPPPVEEEKPVYSHIDFDKLAPYVSSPKEDDVIAYRLIELSSSWTPEISSYRIGKISWFDLSSNQILLVPVPEYPIFPEKKIDDDASDKLPETSIYAEDGSLEIDFQSLLEVRAVWINDLNSTKAVDSEITVSNPGAGTGFEANSQNEACASPQESEKLNPWEEINQVLSAKKSELSLGDNWKRAESSGRKLRSYKASSALGPTIALLRAQDQI